MKKAADTMNHKLKAILLLLIMAALTLITGCSAEDTPYQVNDRENFTVSVRFDANGGWFTTNTSVIVNSYDISQIAADADGMVRVPLLSPDDPVKKNEAFAPANNGYFLAGWYAQRTETADGFVYSDPWDFDSDRLEVEAGAVHSASEPVLTLYAAWVPEFEIEFCNLDGGDTISTVTFEPSDTGVLRVPAWNTETGVLDMFEFPERKGYTLSGVYYDTQGTQAVQTDMLQHPGTVDLSEGIGRNTSMKVYLQWQEGEWYHIYTAEQFKKNASVNGNYILCSDLDFSNEIWPTSLMHGNFSGTIEGNGYTVRNVSAAQTNNSKVSTGLFGSVTEQARILDVTFENVTLTIEKGTRVAGACFGLFAGSVSDGAQIENVSILSGRLLIDSGCYFGTDDYVIGLVCGLGDPSVLDQADIVCEACGAAPENVSVTVDGNEVTTQINTP